MILTIRPEQPEDISEIREIIKLAFKNAPFSNHKEHRIVDELREEGRLILSRVAEEDGKMIGHIAVSPVTISSGAKKWFGIGPVSVIPEWQSKGGGSKLIQSTVELLKETGAKGCVLLGDPAYYQRFGFRPIAGLYYPDVPATHFLGAVFEGEAPVGEVSYPSAFG
ncbi:N-acetyltransferase [Alteromonas pelagimontana]|uniref:N-acetyltransferase n=1 Tax=Alteromonas pelagimontana TaxID=1858656 RepID=A0A6M4MCC0_9ALTE|nr:N-acetyltransferase [Alteromonas pelagimontana]QJR80677.1 N-acetyltransferase [Alteromonas pelagimontana]